MLTRDRRCLVDVVEQLRRGVLRFNIMALTTQYNLTNLSAGWILTIVSAVLLTYIVGSTVLAYFSPSSRYLRSQSKPAVEDEKDSTPWFLPSSIRAGLNSIKHTRDMVFGMVYS